MIYSWQISNQLKGLQLLWIVICQDIAARKLVCRIPMGLYVTVLKEQTMKIFQRAVLESLWILDDTGMNNEFLTVILS